MKRWLSTKTKSEYDVSKLPNEMKDFVKLGSLDTESEKAQSTKSLERGLLSSSALRKFSDDPIYRRGSPKVHSRALSCPDASNLKGLTDDLDNAMAEMLKISGKGKTKRCFHSINKIPNGYQTKENINPSRLSAFRMTPLVVMTVMIMMILMVK